MASLDTLAPDQRAVLDLVLQRGRSYDDIARLLAIDRAAVRARALAAFDELGPDTGIAPESRALITDYLLGQLPARVAEETRERLARSPYERAWARVLASNLESMASKPLPDIPDGSRTAAGPEPEPARAGRERTAAATGARKSRPRDGGPRRAPRLSDRPSSRRGGAIMLAVGTLVVIALVVFLIVILSGGSSTKHSSAASTARPAGTSAGSTSTSKTSAQVVAQINLNPPSGSGPSKGVAFVVKDGSAYGIIIQAQHVAPNSHNAYAVWLYNSPTDSVRVGFVNPGVGTKGQLQTGGALPANAGHFKQLLLTVETQSNPKSPGTIVLEGPFRGVPASG
jgi:hypothetical protein